MAKIVYARPLVTGSNTIRFIATSDATKLTTVVPTGALTDRYMDAKTAPVLVDMTQGFNATTNQYYDPAYLFKHDFIYNPQVLTNPLLDYNATTNPYIANPQTKLQFATQHLTEFERWVLAAIAGGASIPAAIGAAEGTTF